MFDVICVGVRVPPLVLAPPVPREIRVGGLGGDQLHRISVKVVAVGGDLRLPMGQSALWSLTKSVKK